MDRASHTSLNVSGASGFGLIELRGGSPLVAQILPSGALFALRHGPTLLNQFLPGPVEDGLFRLLLRWRRADGDPLRWAPLVGPGVHFMRLGDRSAAWITSLDTGIQCVTQLALHVEKPAWFWSVTVRNDSDASISFDVLHAQDLGLADEGAVRNNEAYTSQYIDLLPVRDETFGWAILARQNQAMAQGRRPWLGFACTEYAAEFCTDGVQFFGVDHRLSGVPAAVRGPALPSQRLQGEFALAGLQSRAVELAPGATRETIFIARFVEDHPATSSPADLTLLRELLDTSGDQRVGRTASGEPDASSGRPDRDAVAHVGQSTSLFVSASWLHGATPDESDWTKWFPGGRRHEERAPDGTLLGFFCDADTHVVSREKEAVIARPHGHILRSGDGRWFDTDHLGLTCYASGIFAAQVYYGHPSFARLLSVARNPLNISRASGQRIFVRHGREWRQLGVPSAFAMTPGEARWIYRLGEQVIELRVCCAREQAAAALELRVLAGARCEFLISHELILGATEFEHAGAVEISAEQGWVGCRPAPASLVGQYQPNVCFAIAAATPEHVAEISTDGLLYVDGNSPSGPYVVFKTRPTERTTLLLLGTSAGYEQLGEVVAAARTALAGEPKPARPLASPLRLRGTNDAGVGRINEILPWFAHNAAIHFSAPHGLEQYGGAAWGVRDVCQGSVEWLLASGEFAVVRRILETVFAQQYPADGSWPQWFMFSPYRFIQQAHSHGDVCFWPVKALCDYIEASGDIGFLNTPVGYTDPQRFVATGPDEPVLAHCERVIAQCEARFISGTALVNYGDGDWDDTLQPADPKLRTHMASAWTVGLAFHAFRQFATVCRRAGDSKRAMRLEALCARIRSDFAARLMPGNVVAGFLIWEQNGSTRPLLHPSDAITHIRYRLLPMTRSILAELFTPEEARRHLTIIAQDLWYPDGVRLMSEPTPYLGGIERLFKRAETAANVGREIGLQYVHAHLRYAEALAKMGLAEELWWALQVVNPVGLAEAVPNAMPRQSNVYFSSSDADFADRYAATARWSELREGSVGVRGGWRLYSSGPGLFVHKVRACLLGVREFFDDIVFDPVLPRRLDGLIAEATLCGRPVELRYRVAQGRFSPRTIKINGEPLSPMRYETNPYRQGGVLFTRAEIAARLSDQGNLIEIAM